MSADRPLPGDVVEDAIDQPFWDACSEGVLLLYRCQICLVSYWPAGACPRHGMREMAWTPACGRGLLHTWTVVHQKYSRSFTDTATIVAVVRLDEGPFFHTNLIDGNANDLAAGTPVEVVFQPDEDGAVLPVFRHKS